MKSSRILAGGLAITLMAASLTGCQTAQIRPVPPTRPVLQVHRYTDGSMYLDKENAAKLGGYIQALERALGIL